MWPGKRVLLYSTFTLLTIFFSPAVSAALPSLTAISNLIDPHTPCTMFSPKSIPPKSPASPTISDRRADLPPSPTPVNAPLSTTSAETENVDQIIERITSRQDDGGLREGRKGISEATKEGTTGMGVVMANSHNDEMQHIPFKLAYSLGLASIECDTWLLPPSHFTDPKTSRKSKSQTAPPTRTGTPTPADATDTSKPSPAGSLLNVDTRHSGGAGSDLGPGKGEEMILYAAHMKYDVRADKTLKGLYLDPLFEILEKANEGKEWDGKWARKTGGREEAEVGEGLMQKVLEVGEALKGHGAGKGKRGVVGEKSWDWNGIYTDRGARDQTLIFMFDVKNNPEDGRIMWPYLLEALEPFRRRGYLTTFHRNTSSTSITDGQLLVGPITIVGTGHTNILQVLLQEPRDIFFDAPLTGLTKPILFTDPNNPSGGMINLDWHPSFAPIASGKFPIQAYATDTASSLIESPERMISSIAEHIRLAQSKGIETRWWGVARWPAAMRWRMWRRLKALGADWINADDLEEVAQFLRDWEEKEEVKRGSEEGVAATKTTTNESGDAEKKAKRGSWLSYLGVGGKASDEKADGSK